MSETVNNLKTLTRQTKSVFCVIDFPKLRNGLFNLNCIDYKELCDDLSRCSFLYAFRLHDKDVNENGELKTPHIHLHLTCDKRHQIKYFIYLLADLLHFDESLISVKVSNSDAGDIQYLIHKNNPDKFQYSSDGIYTNFPKDVFDDLMQRKIITSYTTKELIKLCSENDKLILMEILGPERYNHLRNVINEIYKELRLAHCKYGYSLQYNNNNSNNNNYSDSPK